MTSGTAHWRMQRLTAVALIPLSVWFILIALPHLRKGYAEAYAFLGSFSGALPALFWTGCLFYHGTLGIQVILEDYILCEQKRKISLRLLKGLSWICILVSSFAFFRIFGG